VSKEVAEYPDFLLTREHVLAWEGEHGKIQPGSWLLLRSDWSKRTGRDEFLNIGEDGPHSPGPHPDCVRFLAHERDVLGFGTECVGTDAGAAGGFDPPFPCHNIMHGAGKLGLASLNNLDQLPPTGAIVIAAPLKIVNGSGSPLRVLALVPTD
jgi:kynurenine formamidase